MSVKLICHKTHEPMRIESEIEELVNDGYTVENMIPIFTNPKHADFCILLKKPNN